MKRILFVCTGNTCRSPMAKVILEQMLKNHGLAAKISVDSAGIIGGNGRATDEAIFVIKELFGKDLLKDHRSKSTSELDLTEFNLIIAMEERHKAELPDEHARARAKTLREVAGSKGNVCDPIGGDLETYRKCRDEIKLLIEQAFLRIVE